MPAATQVLDSTDEVAAAVATLFTEARSQALVAVRVTPVYGQLDLTAAQALVDEANARGFTVLREQQFRDEYLLITFEAFEDDDEEELED